MKKIILLCFLSMFLGIPTSLIAQNTIEWSKDRPLSWADFKATPNTEIYAFALTTYDIEIQPSDISVDEDNNIQNYEDLKVVANFYTNLSWVFKESDDLLSHEQLHFDIAALYALKMQIEFEKLKKQKVKNFDSYSEIYSSLWAECRKIQNVYDEETSHGQRIEENNNWINKITQEIESLE